MRKILLSLFATSATSVFAINNGAFQQFDNQYNFGYGISQTQLSNGAFNQTLQQNQLLNLEVERLFDAGIWLNVTGNLLLNTNSLGNTAEGTGQGQSALSQDPTFAGVNAKVGYAFPVVTQHLQLTPYGLVGRNANLAKSTVTSNSTVVNSVLNTPNITNDIFYTGGVGARIEYRISRYIDVYADQLAAYNWDQSGPVNGVQPQNNMVFTSTLGAKFNIVKNLQLGINGFYSNYQYQATAPLTTLANGTQGNCPASIYQPQSTMGGFITVGLTY